MKEGNNMFSKDDILTLLREGADPTELAQKFADVLNEAVAEKQKTDKFEVQKREDWNNLLNAINGWLVTYAPKTYEMLKADIATLNELAPDKFIKALEDSATETETILREMEKHLKDLEYPTKTNPEEKKKSAAGRSEVHNSDLSAMDDIDILFKWLQDHNI